MHLLTEDHIMIFLLQVGLLLAATRGQFDDLTPRNDPGAHLRILRDLSRTLGDDRLHAHLLTCDDAAGLLESLRQSQRNIRIPVTAGA